MKTYRLLKDLPYAKAWAIYTDQNDWSYKTDDVIIDSIQQDTLNDLVVEKTPEWFEEVKEDKVDSLILKIQDNFWNHTPKIENILREHIKDDWKEELIKRFEMLRHTWANCEIFKEDLNNYIIIKI